MLTKDELPECPVATTVQLIGSKWKLLIMRNLMMRPWRFNELKKSLEGISQKVLTDSLRSMEEDGLITRIVHPAVKVPLRPRLTGSIAAPVVIPMAVFPLGKLPGHKGARRSRIMPQRKAVSGFKGGSFQNHIS